VLVVLALVLAAGYLGRRAWRTWGARSGCSGGCGCASPARGPADGRDRAAVTLIPPERLTLRTRPPGGGG
jgi:hypothetical protein